VNLVKKEGGDSKGVGNIQGRGIENAFLVWEEDIQRRGMENVFLVWEEDIQGWGRCGKLPCPCFKKNSKQRAEGGQV
jgi:hypothetical protein